MYLNYIVLSLFNQVTSVNRVTRDGGIINPNSKSCKLH